MAFEKIQDTDEWEIVRDKNNGNIDVLQAGATGKILTGGGVGSDPTYEDNQALTIIEGGDAGQVLTSIGGGTPTYEDVPIPEKLINDTAQAFLFKYIEIGTWNMDSTDRITVSHNIGDKTKYRGCQCIIFDDSGNVWDFFHHATPDGRLPNETSIGDNTMVLYRTNGGFFDNSSFDGSVSNRGILTVFYTE